MADETEGMRDRFVREGEDALGRLIGDLLESPVVRSAISAAFDAREKAAQAQEAAFGVLNLPSASDLERLTRRVRSVAQRLEGIEDGVDRLERRVGSLPAAEAVDARLAAIEERLDELASELRTLHQALAGASAIT